jgi:hypothetical protein
LVLADPVSLFTTVKKSCAWLAPHEFVSVCSRRLAALMVSPAAVTAPRRTATSPSLRALPPASASVNDHSQTVPDLYLDWFMGLPSSSSVLAC